MPSVPGPRTPSPDAAVTGGVLAGGRSSRLGRDKALLELAGETLLARAVGTLAAVCGEVLVIGPAERAAVVPDVRVVPDERPGVGPLGGIASALRVMTGGRLLAVATDMPLLSLDLLRYLVQISADFDVTLPRVDGRTQQLHAVYARRCLPVIDEQLAREDFKIDRFFAHVRTRIIEEDELRRFDPELRSFRNINTEADWQAVQELIAAPSTPSSGGPSTREPGFGPGSPP